MLRSGRADESEEDEDVLCCTLGGEFLARREERMSGEVVGVQRFVCEKTRPVDFLDAGNQIPQSNFSVVNR